MGRPVRLNEIFLLDDAGSGFDGRKIITRALRITQLQVQDSVLIQVNTGQDYIIAQGDFPGTGGIQDFDAQLPDLRKGFPASEFLFVAFDGSCQIGFYTKRSMKGLRAQRYEKPLTKRLSCDLIQ